MQLRTIEYAGFGPSGPRAMQLADGWTVISAPNETGKSSLLRAIRAALFGSVPPRPPESQISADRVWVKASLRTAEGADFEVAREMTARERRKKSPSFDSHYRSGSSEIDAARFAAAVGVSQLQGAGLLTVSQVDLAAGRDRLGRLDDLLFGGGMGSVRQIARLNDEIEKRLKEMQPRGAKNSRRPIDIALREMKSAADERDDVMLLPEEHHQMLDRRDELRKLATRQETTAAARTLERSRVEALLKAHEIHSEAAELRVQADALALQQPLTTDEAKSILAIVERRRGLAEQIIQTQADRQNLESLRAAIAAQSPLDECVEVVRRLDREASEIELKRTAVQDNRQSLIEAEQTLAAMGEVPELTGQVDPLLRRLRELGDAITAAGEDCRSAERAVDKATVEREEAERQQAEASTDSHAAIFATASEALAKADGLGDLADRTRDVEQAEAKWRADEERLAGRVGWSCVIAEGIPSEACASEAEEALNSARRQREDARKEHAAAGRAVRKLAASLNSITKEGRVVSREELLAAREERDAAWTAVRGMLFEETEVERTARVSAADRLTRQSGEADRLADDRFENAGQVAKSEQLTLDWQAAVAEEAAAKALLEQAEKELKTATHDLDRIWEKHGASPLGPADTLLFRREWQALQTRQEEVQIERSELDYQLQQVREAETAARAAMKALDADGPEPLPWLRQELAERQKSALRRESEAARLPRLREAEGLAEAELRRLNDRREEVASQLRDALQEAGLPMTLSPREAEDAVRQSHEATRLRQSIDQTRRSIEFATKDIKEFEASLEDVRATLASDPATRALRTLEEIVAASDERTDERAKRDERLVGVREFTAREEDLRSRVQAAEADLPNLADVGVADIEALETLANDSLRWRQLAAEEETLRRSVRTMAVGDHATFEQDLTNGSAEDWKTRRERLSAEAETLREQAKESRAEADRIDGQLGEFARSDRVRTLSGIIESERGKLREAIEDFAPLHILSSVLHRAGERSREREPELLLQVGEVLSKITDGRHVAVERTTDDRLVITEETPNGRVKKSPAELSQGARELVYLAVRLEYTRRRARRSPLPLVLDDVLVNMDEDRQRAVLGVLSELADSTQVILLTCHAKTVEIAESLSAATFTKASLN